MPAVLDSIIEVATPENIAFRYQVAGPFRRCPAWGVDVLIRTGLLLLSLFGLNWVASIGREWSSLGLAIGLVVWFLAEWFYGGVFETYWNGQTPGKRWMRLRVLSVDGRPINGLQAILRNILRSVDLMPVVGLTFLMEDPLAIIPTGFVGFACMIGTRHFQRLGDIVCGTIVVVEERVRIPVVADDVPATVSKLEKEIPSSFRASRTFMRALALYWDRSRHLSTARRHEIARHVGQTLMAQWDLPRETDPDDLLIAIYRHGLRRRSPELGENVVGRTEDEMLGRRITDSP